MYFNKYPYRANFTFADRFEPANRELRVGERACRMEATAFEGGIARLRVLEANRKPSPAHLVELTPPPLADDSLLRFGPGGEPCFAFGGRELRGRTGEAFGRMGEAWMLQFDVGPDTRYFGMGEKNLPGFERSGLRTKFWNTDVWADFHPNHFIESYADPSYVSIPYLIVKQGDVCLGILVHSEYPAFMETPTRPENREVFVEWQRTADHLILGAEGGTPDVWFLVGPTLPELTRKLQGLVGKTPLPPLWALGYHQSRWGYATPEQLTDLDDNFRKHKIPCDGIWLDIEHMDGFRVFTVDPETFPEGIEPTVWKLWRNRRRVVPILDPGVKRDPGYDVYDDGRTRGVFCQNVDGGEFVGLVWPGDSVFPDFTLPRVRNWWAGKVRDFTGKGFAAYWVDMNDPATGASDPHGMRFDRGRTPHAAYHNAYALGMQMATHEGLRRAKPRARTFLLSRSGSVGTSRVSAIWSGDNVANRHWLAMSIPTALNLALSGVPFNGADMGGFGGDTSEAILVDWTKAHFLMPFLRNHTMKGARRQEPWAYSRRALGIVRRYLRLRYKLLPYLANLFAEQAETGEAILRPLNYEFADPDLDFVADRFLVGPSILQAPFLEEGRKDRVLPLPGDEPWFDACAGQWVSGETTLVNTTADTPVFFRAGAIVPMAPGLPTTNRKDLAAAEFHCFVPPTWRGESRLVYRADDGETLGYAKGERSTIEIELTANESGVRISWRILEDGFGSLRPVFVLHGVATAMVNGETVAWSPVSVPLVRDVSAVRSV
ncbi:MAG: hypothetical protein KIS66_09810 [Fimbriimonadaceae bacterium]|nr:hypothetical protein [Fimbriimonadaceae bacterium]